MDLAQLMSRLLSSQPCLDVSAKAVNDVSAKSINFYYAVWGEYIHVLHMDIPGCTGTYRYGHSTYRYVYVVGVKSRG